VENKNEIKRKVELRQQIKELQTKIDEMKSTILTLPEMNKRPIQKPT
jgi:TolA-binding protein